MSIIAPRARHGEPGSESAAPGTLSVHLKRPDALRVDNDAGRVLLASPQLTSSRDAFYVAGTRSSWLLPPALIAPVYDDDQLVLRRPEARYGDPGFGDDRLTALLDPVEFAGAAPPREGQLFGGPVRIDELAQTEREGRATSVATVVPNLSYSPAYGPVGLLEPSVPCRVEIDEVTSVCVGLELLAGPNAGAGHSVTILGVNEDLTDDLFTEQSASLTDVRAHIPWVVGQW
ncbi:hypothetical protein [Zhihengliuella flava]|uniref:Uncharacterized protein n=1 Tax=Zhihengliuella flava TaxID=1285193 RepID=A0A931GEV7_9MICC|nr:hypothetical protein [Zhihengliuella flava]MBG6083987.1 hypothetical protein [Zhihengliuella flava]